MLVFDQNMQPRRRRVVPLEDSFTCQHCHKVFEHESKYLAHKCKAMKRAEELKTPAGQAAWNYYTMWFRAMKRIPPSSTAFLASKYFTTFFNFVAFSKRVNLPKPEKFITYMVQKNFQPTMWITDPIYVMYIEYIDLTLSPMEQVKMSIDTLFSVTDAHEIDTADVFTVLRGNDIIQMLRTRRLSPWLLLNSKKFKILYAQEMSEEERSIIDTLVRFDYWATKLKEHAAVVQKIKLLVAELGI